MPSPKNTNQQRLVYLDLTHVGRHVTGIERIAIELFEKVDFVDADVRAIRSNGTLSMILKQQILLPLLALMKPHAHFVFPGFPPAPWFVLCRERITWYVHDLFLMTRRSDLSTKAKLYMARPFAFAVRRLKHFLVNSQKTEAELKPFVRDDAQIALYRPKVENIFDLDVGDRNTRNTRPTPLKLVSVGTVEPRKNYPAAVAIRDALCQLGFPETELHIVGRAGWGAAGEKISNHPNVIVHGYLGSEAVKRVLEGADIYLCTSFDEGLGLPLLEAQYAGLPIFAPDANIFHEVLGQSGHFIPLDNIPLAAQTIVGLIETTNWRVRTSQASCDNPKRWNALASGDLELARHMFVHRQNNTVTASSLDAA